MNALTVQELQIQGLAALESALQKGPVHILKQDRPVWVVIREEEYAALQQPQNSPHTPSILDVFAQAGSSGRTELDHRIRAERAAWDKA